MNPEEQSAPRSGSRLVLPAAIAAGLIVATLTTFLLHRSNTLADFDQIHFAAYALLHGYDPYSLIGPDRIFPWKWPFFYPLPAAIIALPLATLPRELARAIFVFLSTTTYAWAVGSRLGRYGVFAILNIPFALAALTAQWSPLLAAVFVLPGLGWLAIAKPTVGITAVTVGLRGRRAVFLSVGVAFVLLTISLILQPSWIQEWRASVASGTHLGPYISRPTGLLLLLAVLRWRRPEAWVFLLFIIIPGSPGSYELLLPIAAFHFYGTVTFRTSALLSVLTMPIVPLSYALPATDFALWSTRAAVINMIFVLYPLLGLLLLRPNRGTVPDLVEHFARRLPAPIRGSPS